MTSEEVGAKVAEGDLEGALTTLTLLATDIRREMRKKFSHNLVVLIAVAVLGLIGLGIGALGINTAHQTSRSTASARLASCLQYNKQQAAQVTAEISESHDFVTALVADAGDSAAARARGAAFDVEHDQRIRNAHTSRDCTAAGIRLYLKTSTTRHLRGSR